MGMGHSHHDVRGSTGRSRAAGSPSPLTPELVYALAAGNTDGLAVMDGGNLANFNNFIDGAQAGQQRAVHRGGDRARR